jgi:hypothetical protein
MTPDIVERLRGENWWLNVSGDEAAGKIEQLQGELQTVHAHLRHLRELLDDLRAENKLLKAALDERIQEQNEDAR